MREAIDKLSKAPISAVNAHLCYNMYLLQRAYFGCGIMRLMQNQEKKLIKISKSILLKKIGLSEKFPRGMLCARKSALGVRLIKLSIMVLISALKLCAGNVRARDRIAKITNVNEDNAMLQNGYSNHIFEAPVRDDKEVVIWSEEIGWELQKQKIEITNNYGQVN